MSTVVIPALNAANVTVAITGPAKRPFITVTVDGLMTIHDV
jgi:hypothetical protein